MSDFSLPPLLLLDQPERTALVFLGGVCVGLLITLSAIVFQIHCRADCHYGHSKHPQHRHKKRHHRHHQPIGGNPDSTAVVASGVPTGDSESEDWDETSDLSARRRRRFERALLHASMFTSAEGNSQTHDDTHHRCDPRGLGRCEKQPSFVCRGSTRL